MANMSPKKNPIPEQDPNVRNKNFKEVTLGYTAEMAINEAKRCLQCKKPHCVEGCPVNIHIPEFIHEVAEGNFEKAYEIITDTNALPALSGRVCPQESQCEMHCVRGKKGDPVGIGRLERFVADWYRENINAMPKKAESNGIKVAVVGSGPSGLTCASLLAKKGYAVSLFEALHTAGGVLVYGIPEFRLPKAIVANEVEKLKAQGVEVMTDMVIGKVLSIDELFEMGFKAVFIGSGAGLPMFMHIPGESLKGVCSANEYLTRINLMKAYREDSDTPIMDLKGKKVAMTWAYSPSYGKPLSVPQGVIGLFTRFGMDVTLAHPEGYDVMPEVEAIARQNCEKYGSRFHKTNDMKEAFRDADIVYPKSWAPFAAMEERTKLYAKGEQAGIDALEKKLLAQNAEHKDWACTEEMMKLTRDGKALYMHCLPADITGLSCEEGEVDNSVFDRYIVPLYKQASYKPYIIAAMIFMSQVKDPVRTLMAMDEGNGKRKSF